MGPEEISTQEKIILAAINCIEKEGLQAVTIRSIATEADVNIAAINYYFRSKDNLINEVLKATRDHMFADIDEIMKNERKKPLTRLNEVLRYLLDGAIRYPRLSKAHFYDAFTQSNYAKGFVPHFNKLLDDLQSMLEQDTTLKNRRKIKLTIVQILSTVFFNGIFPEFFREFSGSNFSDELTRKTYINHLVQHYFD